MRRAADERGGRAADEKGGRAGEKKLATEVTSTEQRQPASNADLMNEGYVRTNVQMARILPKVSNYASIFNFLDKILAYLIFL